jgi:transcriptional regulator with XRE-family HTH domain
MPEQPRPGDQPLPVANDGPSMHDLVIEDLDRWPVSSSTQVAIRELLAERKRLGLERYGSLLQRGNGRDWLRDLREECADALVYARQGLEELGVSIDRSTLSNIENLKTKYPPVKVIPALARVLGLEADEMFKAEDAA